MNKDKTKDVKDLDKKELKRLERKKEKKERKEKLKNKVPKQVAIKRIVLLVLIIVWAVFVFGFSSQTGNESSGLSRKIAEIFFKTEEALAIAEPIIRKLAHFSEYALGGVLMYLLIDTYNYSRKTKFFLTLFLGIWYAAIDEIHQTFVPDRSGNIRDVFIDTLGFSFGIGLTLIYLKIKNKILSKKDKKVKVNSEEKEEN